MRATKKIGRRAAIGIGLAVALVGVLSMTATASHTFLDVPDDHVFHDDIEWMEETGVTRGCNPPANTNYCPDEFTTRGQMAAFFHRFSDSGVINAGTLDGMDSTEFLGVDDKAADSDLLDGIDSTEFVQQADLGGDLAAALGDAIYVNTTSENYLLGASISQSTSCDGGDVLLTGGFQSDGLTVNIASSFPDGASWQVEGTATVAATLVVYAVCVSV